MPSARQSKRPNARGATGSPSLRVIGGQWRSRLLPPVADRPGLRPTPNRVRETLFNWLAPRIDGAICVDLFAGTGALGIEALSRGAATAVFIERDRLVAQAIRSALGTLGAADRARVIAADACCTNRILTEAPIDIVFIDPPFDDQRHAAALAGLQGLLDAQSRLYIEYPAASEAQIAAILGNDYEILRRARSAGVGFCLARMRPGGDHESP